MILLVFEFFMTRPRKGKNIVPIEIKTADSPLKA